MRIKFNSPVILVFSSLCILAYLFSNGLGIFKGGFVLYPNWNTSTGIWYIRLFSYTLGHANMGHILGNLSFILLLGPIIESRYGSKRLTIMILITALVTAVLHILFFSHALIGASGIVFMLILLTPLVDFSNKEIPLTFILIVLIFIGKEIIGSFNDDNISHFAHIMGGIVGAIFGFIYKRRGQVKKDISKKVPLP